MGSNARVPLFLVLATPIRSQSFEVASIKPLAPPDRVVPGQMLRDPGQVIYRNVRLENFLAQAYRIKNFQMSGPDWLDSDRFDIVAKLPPEAHDDQLPAMLQGLLRERFHLTFHREPKTMSAYVLLTAKAGPKMRRANRRWCPFAGLLSNMLDRPVVNMTELKGIYDVDLEWSVDDIPDRTVQPNDPPSLFAALQEKLGLRLDTRKAPVDIYVIDHVERVPTEN